MKKLGWTLTLLMLVALQFALSGCTDEPRTRSTLRNFGFTDVRVTGYEYWGCSDSDNYHTGFTAKNAQGAEVSGVVCCGFAKACTIRF